ncbi:MAG: haloacid dehalogenase [Chloroflexi bacterium]|nr:haloacid dehalogenase [Chloroflexota bacterium]
MEPIADRIRASLTAKDAARESVLPQCREVIRHCSLAIRAIHRQEFSHARRVLETARDLLCQSKKTITDCAELSNIGFFRDAQKEFAEASITLALITRKQLPDPSKLDIEAAPYLNGLGEAVGELRRYLLDSMRRNDLSHCEELLSAMDDIYGVLVTMDFPDAITDGLRRTTDMVRGVLERTRSDLTLVKRQEELENRLKEFSDKLPTDNTDRKVS